MKKYIIPDAEIVIVKAEAQLATQWSGHHIQTLPTSETGEQPTFDYGDDE